MTDSEIEEYLVRLDNEVLSFKDRLFNISWHMRGGVTMHELLHIYSEDDLEILDNIIKQHINLTKEIQMPLL
jgi:hypothetical protein